jgi:hypothetical protein
MPRRNPQPEPSDEVREATNAAFDAMAECHKAVAESSERVVAKIAEAARVLGWPDQVVSGVVNQIQSIAEMQMKMIDHTMEIWREQIKSWPSVTSSGHWPDAQTLTAMSVNPVQYWIGIGEQWQKSWAQTMMSQWTKSSKRNVPPKSDDRE